MKLIHITFDRENDTPIERTVAVAATDKEFTQLKGELEDSFSSYMESTFDESQPTPYTTAVNEVMDACGHDWMPLNESDLHTIRI